MDLDNADTIRRFIAQITGQPEYSSINTVTSPSSTQHDSPANEHVPTMNNANNENIDEYNKPEGAKTPPNATVADQDHHHLASPEAHPKPSPHFSGLKAPFNTPKTAASSPRLLAAKTHNEDVAEALADYVNTVNSRPLSESIWAPGSGRYKPSMLGGPRSTGVLTPIKAVEPNPAINDTFDRMSFKAADSDPKTDENLIGDRVTRSVVSKAPSSKVTQPYVLADKLQGGKVDDVVRAKLEKASDEDFETPPQTETMERVKRVQVKIDEASKEDLPNTAHTDQVGKEHDAPSTPKASVPLHLRATRVSGQKSVKAETKLPYSESLGPVVTSNTADIGSVKDAVPRDANDVEPKATTGPAHEKPLTMPSSASENVGSVKDIVRTYTTNGAESKTTTVPTRTKPMIGPSSASENLEHKVYFNDWPKLEERSRPAAKVRKVIIKDLPYGSTATFVASLVYGGPVEEINIRPSAAGTLSAVVRFMDGGDCKKFYDDTSNGLVYGKDANGRELILLVELSRDVDVVGGLLQGWIASGVTRCVRAVGVNSEWDLDGLRKIAERKNRKVEKIVDGQNPGGARSVVFRFCKVDDAVQFKGALSRDEEWEYCNVHYAPDPCATASGVHFEN